MEPAASIKRGEPASATRRYRSDELARFAARALSAAGIPSANAATVAGLMVQADLRGADGHGIFRLPHYVRRIRSGGVNVKPNIRIVRETLATALVDGDNGMGQLVMDFATRLAIEKAAKAGVGWVGARRSNHAGPAALYAMMPMERDMIGLYMAVGNANHVAPFGGVEPLLSTNPIAVAIPGLEEPPVVLDMATTVAAFGKVKTARQRGESIPEGWMIDGQGNPITDPMQADHGTLLPIGGYKGYGLALAFGFLAGTLNGAAHGRDVIDFNADLKSATNTGHAIMAIDIGAFSAVEEFKKHADLVIRDIRNSAKAPGIERIWLPGERSHTLWEERRAHGIPLHAHLVEALRTLAEELAIPTLE
jgi:LDH2 family malate/lactate/ureidoglycolate dehydrogenase